MKGNCGECDRRWYCDIDPGKCDEWPDPVPMTNADRFRAMSDEEQQKCVRRFWEIEDFADWLQQPAEPPKEASE